jgi:hypothetical protein
MLVTFSVLAFGAAVGLVACAQDGADLGSGTDPTTDPDAGGTVVDSAAPPTTQDSSTPPTVDSAPPPPPQDSGVVDSGATDSAPPPAPDAAPLPNGDCDTSGLGGFVYPVEAASELKNGTATPCPCSAAQCCYHSIVDICVSR